MKMGERGSNTDAGRANGGLDMLIRIYGKDMIYKQCIGKERGAVSRIGKERGAVSRWDTTLQHASEQNMEIT